MKRLFTELLYVLLGLIFAWVIVANTVFAFRHPWMTETERFIHFVDAMEFKKVVYAEARPR